LKAKHSDPKRASSLPEIPLPFLGRLIHPLIRERRSLAGALSWMGLGILFFFIFIAVFAPLLVPFSQTQPFASPVLQAPSLQHLMGTDNVGRDVLSRVIWGARTSLEIMAIGVLIALAVGFPVGLLSGYLRVSRAVVGRADSGRDRKGSVQHWNSDNCHLHSALFPGDAEPDSLRERGAVCGSGSGSRR